MSLASASGMLGLFFGDSFFLFSSSWRSLLNMMAYLISSSYVDFLLGSLNRWASSENSLVMMTYTTIQ